MFMESELTLQKKADKDHYFTYHSLLHLFRSHNLVAHHILTIVEYTHNSHKKKVFLVYTGAHTHCFLITHLKREDNTIDKHVTND